MSVAQANAGPTRGERLRVLLAIPDLQDLGVQHDVRSLLLHWDQEQFETALLVHKREGNFADQFPAEARVIEVDRLIPDLRGLRIGLRVLGYARAFRAFRPQAVISFVPYTNLASILARPLSGVSFGLAVSEHAHVTASLRDPESFKGLFSWLYRRSFRSLYNRGADLVKCIAEESRRDLVENHGIVAAKTRLIHNPVEVEEVRRLATEPVDHPWFSAEERARVPLLINVGRLQQQKRQDRLLEAFAQLRGHRPARLVLVGRGTWRVRLEAQARELGVAADVLFLGFQRNPWRFMARASLLAMSSEWEGLPCVLTEAMALGLPIVATRCPSGPSEMLLDGRAGLLVPVGDTRALAAAAEQILAAPETARERARIASEALVRFLPETITPRYEALARELWELAHRVAA
jgi:glycosyltransferase involved in cell wall biosynthesis